MSVTAIDNIIFGGPIVDRITKNGETVGAFCLRHLHEHGEKVVLIDGINGIEITASKLLQLSIDYAQNLEALGVGEGDAVGICCENRLEFVYAMYATIFLNATVAPYNLTYTEREMLHAMNLSRPKIVFASASTIKNVTATAKKTSFVNHIICFDDIKATKIIIPLPNFLKMHDKKSEEAFQIKPADTTNNVFAILCSSGTTGLAKGVQITQSNILFNADVQYGTKSFIMEATVLTVIPWFHSYGLIALLMLTTVGAKLVFLPKFQDKLFLHCIQRFQINVCLLVPPLMVFLAKHPLVAQYDLSSVKALFCGAASLSKETEQAVRKRLGVPIIRQAYGLSESTLGVLAHNDDHCKPGSVGTVRKGIYAKVVDIETGRPLGPNQSGELCFKGALIMKGYVGDKKATEKIIDGDGWLHTGDIGYYDDELNFYIVDRIKELIKYKGYQVPPAEIESLLLTNPKIKDAAVVGMPDEECGELPLAFVVKSDPSLTAEDVIQFVTERSSPAKRLRGGVRFIDEIPKSQTGKILRRVLREKVKREIKSKL